MPRKEHLMYQRLSKRVSTAREDGFTLIELLIVIVILGILAGIVVFAVGTATSDSKLNACKADKKTIETALEAYKAKKGTYPADAEAELIVNSASAGGPYLQKWPWPNEDYDFTVTTLTKTITVGNGSVNSKPTGCT